MMQARADGCGAILEEICTQYGSRPVGGDRHAARVGLRLRLQLLHD
jgi:hypothetical protein